MSQGWQLLSLDSRLRLKLAREELALSLPPNPEDAPLLLTPQPRNHASHHFLVFSRLIRGIPSVIFLVLVQAQMAGCERFLLRWSDGLELEERRKSNIRLGEMNLVDPGWEWNGSWMAPFARFKFWFRCWRWYATNGRWSKMIVFRISPLEAAVEISPVFYINRKWL